MKRERRLLNQAEAARATALELAVVRLCADSGIIAPAEGYGEDDLAELRRVRRLMHDLELDQPAIEVILRLRRQVLALQAQVVRLERELHTARRPARTIAWVDADWSDIL